MPLLTVSCPGTLLRRIQGDVLISQGEAPEEMYFIQHGAVMLERRASSGSYVAPSSPPGLQFSSDSRSIAKSNLVDVSGLDRRFKVCSYSRGFFVCVCVFDVRFKGSYFGELPFLFPATVKLQPFSATVMMSASHSATESWSGGSGDGGGGSGHSEVGAVLHSISGMDLAQVFGWFPELQEMMAA